MTPSARLAAAIEVISDIEARRRPAADALKDWGLAHRFAGSGDRAAIAGLVFDALRRKASAAYLMGSDAPRAIALGMLVRERGLDVEAVTRLADGARFAPPPLSAEDRKRIANCSLEGAPAHVHGDYPEWLDSLLARTFGDARVAEAEALASRAPLDLRVNTLKATRAQARASLEHLDPQPTPWSPVGLRLRLSADARSPAIQAEPAFLKGLIEVQDEGSQLTALLSGAKPGMRVIDLCAGGGGKTLALAAVMNNDGAIVATDLDKRRLAPIHARLERSGARHVEVRTPAGAADPVADRRGWADLVLVDAPCTGTGTWRRNPDAKWRIRPGAIEQRAKDQVAVLDRASALVRPGGRLVYVTCSLLTVENNDQVRAFMQRHPEFSLESPSQVAESLGERATDFLEAALTSDEGMLMTPRRTGTDGFFVAVLSRAAV